MGQKEQGEFVPAHDIESFRTFGYTVLFEDDEGNEIPKAHGGIDFIWSTTAGIEPNAEAGDATLGAPAYAIADGKLICENRGLTSYTSWPGRVIIIEHTLAGGERFYSLYGHLRYPPGGDPFGDPDDEDLDALPTFSTEANGYRHPDLPAIYVRRGQQIGTVMEWRNDNGTRNISNTHLHFEIRTRARGAWNGACPGGGYAPTSGKDPGESVEEWLEEDYYWLNPVDFIYEHGPSVPVPVLTDSRVRTQLRTEPSHDSGEVLFSIPRSSQLLAVERQRGNDNDKDWWYKVTLGRPRPLPPRPLRGRGWINAYKSTIDSWPYTRESEILVGEMPQSLRPPQNSRPLVEYLFDVPERIADGYTRNTGTSGSRYDARVEGSVGVISVPYEDHKGDLALELDGRTAFVENFDRRGATTFPDVFREGVAVSAQIRRDRNVNEDAIVSKWFNQDQWLLTFYWSGHGNLRFSVRLSDGSYVDLDYSLPDDDYLGNWFDVAASYETEDLGPLGSLGRLRLYWGGWLVATKEVVGPDVSLWSSDNPIHVGDAGPGVSWSRFDGAIDDVRIWRLRKEE